jgi:hypothetical protein
MLHTPTWIEAALEICFKPGAGNRSTSMMKRVACQFRLRRKSNFPYDHGTLRSRSNRHAAQTVLPVRSLTHLISI